MHWIVMWYSLLTVCIVLIAQNTYLQLISNKLHLRARQVSMWILQTHI